MNNMKAIHRASIAMKRYAQVRLQAHNEPELLWDKARAKALKHTERQQTRKSIRKQLSEYFDK